MPFFFGGGGGGGGGSADLTTFDPTVQISAGSVQDAIEEVYQESLQPQVFHEVLPVTINGQMVFSLSNVPYNDNAVDLYVNSSFYKNGTDFTVSGQALTWLNNGFILTTDDQVVAVYFRDIDG